LYCAPGGCGLLVRCVCSPAHVACVVCCGRNGDLYTFGHGRDGRLGHGWTPEGSPENLPRLVTDLKVGGRACGTVLQPGHSRGRAACGQGQVAQVALGEFHGVCLTKDAKVYSWGKSFRRGNILGHDETHGCVCQGCLGVGVADSWSCLDHPTAAQPPCRA